MELVPSSYLCHIMTEFRVPELCSEWLYPRNYLAWFLFCFILVLLFWSFQIYKFAAREASEWIKASATNTNDLSSIPGTYLVGEKNLVPGPAGWAHLLRPASSQFPAYH